MLLLLPSGSPSAETTTAAPSTVPSRDGGSSTSARTVRSRSWEIRIREGVAGVHGHGVADVQGRADELPAGAAAEPVAA